MVSAAAARLPLGSALLDLEGALVEVGRLRRGAAAVSPPRSARRGPCERVDLAADGDRPPRRSGACAAPPRDVTKTLPGDERRRPPTCPAPAARRPPSGPMPRTRTSDSAPDDVSHAATPMWSAAAAARSAPMPERRSVWVSSGPDCQVRAVVRRRVVELQARGGVVGEDGVQAPGRDPRRDAPGRPRRRRRSSRRRRTSMPSNLRTVSMFVSASPRAGTGPTGRPRGAGSRRSRCRPAASSSRRR